MRASVGSLCGALAMLAFLGGFSSATSMVIVETIALATMIGGNAGTGRPPSMGRRRGLVM